MTLHEPIKRILVVDDDTELAKTITTHLRWEGYQVIHAGDGLEAKKMITAARTSGRSFDVVITDYLMPHSDGLELVTWIKQNHAEIFIIVMSGYLDHDTLRDIMRPEKDAYKIKPITPFDIEKLLGRIEIKRQSRRQTPP
jgi:DNA-binding NtrC family response regulator